MSFPPIVPTIREVITSGGPRDKEVIRPGGPTNDPTPVVTGYGRAGTNITVYVDGKPAGSGIVSDDGVWRVEIASATPIANEGTRLITATSSNAAGESQHSEPYPVEFDTTPPSAPRPFTAMDYTGPDQGEITQGSKTDEQRPILAGTGDAGDTVIIHIDGKESYRVLVDASGNWSFGLLDPLPEGEHAISIQMIDPAGNLSAMGDPLHFVVEVGDVYVTFQEAYDDYGPIQGFIPHNGKTDDLTPTLRGSALGNSTLTIYNEDGAVLTTFKVPASGLWSYELPQQAEGFHTYKAVAENFNGTKAEADFSLTIDHTPPSSSPVVTAVSDDTGTSSTDFITNDQTLIIHGKVTLPLADDEKVQISIDGGAWVDAVFNHHEQTWYYDNRGVSLTEGAHIITARTVDEVGNIGPTSEQVVHIDLSPPEAQSIITSVSDDTGQPGDFVTSDRTLIIHGRIEGVIGAGEKVEISFDGTKWLDVEYEPSSKTWSFDNRSVVLSDGSHTIHTRVIDTAGNVGGQSKQVVVIDTTAPSAASVITGIADDTGVSDSDFVTSDRTLVIRGRVDGWLGADERVEVSLDNGQTWLATDYDATAHSWVLDNRHQTLAYGDYTFKTRVIDRAGNFDPAAIHSQVVRIVYDKPANVPTIDHYIDDYGPLKGKFYSGSFTDDTTPTLHGRINEPLQEGQKVAIYRGSTLLGYAAMDHTGAKSWSFTDTGLTAGNTYIYNAVVVNETGGIGHPSNSFEIHITSNSSMDVPDLQAGEDSYSASVALGNNGEWIIVAGQSVYRATGEGFSEYSSQLLEWNASDASDISSQYWLKAPVFGAYTLADYNRDGFLDIFTTDRTYIGRTGTMFFGVDDGKMSNAVLVKTGATVHMGGVMSIDMDGDGYLDVILGDSGNDSMTFLHNRASNGNGNWYKGQWDVYGKNSGFTARAIRSLVVDHEVSGVDLNNDGAVDFVGHAYQRSDKNAMTVLLNDGRSSRDGSNWRIGQTIANVFGTNGVKDDTYDDTVSMTWGDYNGDGYLDLFIGQGRNSAGRSSDSIIYYNNGSGMLGTPQRVPDGMGGKTSVAVDWDCDGKMDVIEIPDARHSMEQLTLFYHNTGRTDAQGQVVWELGKLADFGYMQTARGALSLDNTVYGATGASLVDYDWDGSMDLIISARVLSDSGYAAFSQASQVSSYCYNPHVPATAYPTGSVVVNNPHKPGYGTALHLRILNPDGSNTFYGNTVQLYDSAGKLVSTQIINAQSGSGQNDGTALVHFYGFDSSETYSAVLFHNKNGMSNDFGGLRSMSHDMHGPYRNVIENYNATWGGLKARQAHDAYVLTAEPDSGISSAQLGNGVVGTGYNDTFFAMQGSHIYNGGGGWTVRNGVKTWSATGGEDIVDFRLAGISGINVDLSLSGYQNSGFGNVRFINIEGVYGADGDDTFTDGQGDNIFNGRAGNDTYNLLHGGHNTIVYEAVAANDGAGGNGHDVANGFTLADFNGAAASDRIDLSQLLIGYERDIDGPAHYVNGIAVIDAEDNIADYLSVRHEGNNTVLYIDRDGKGGVFDSQALITLSDVHADLETLLANQQIVV